MSARESLCPHEVSHIGWSTSRPSCCSSSGDEYESLVDPFFHSRPGTLLEHKTVGHLARRRQRWMQPEAPRNAPPKQSSGGGGGGGSPLLDRYHRCPHLHPSTGPIEHRGVVRVDFDLMRNVTLPVQCSFVWPRIAPTVASFERTEQGATSATYVRVRNPSREQKVWVQLLLPDEQPPLQALADRLENTPLLSAAQGRRWWWWPRWPWAAASAASAAPAPEPEEGERIVVTDAQLAAFSSSVDAVQQVLDLLSRWRRAPAAFTLSAAAREPKLLAPGESARLGPVHFSPHASGPQRGLLFVRNNLTLIDEIIVTGIGASGPLDFVSAEDAERLEALEGRGDDLGKEEVAAGITTETTTRRRAWWV